MNSSPIGSTNFGFSILELLISMTIGIILSVGLIQITSYNKRMIEINGDAVFIQENARFAISIIRDSIRLAGNTVGDGDDSNHDQACSDNFVPLSGCDGIACDNNDTGDTITIRHEATTDCLGQAVAVNPAVDTYYIKDNNLFCLGSGSVTPQALIEEIETMHFLYGVDTTGDLSINQYVKANQVGTNKILSVQVGILARSANGVRYKDIITNYSLLDATAGPFQDKKRRLAVESTIAVRSCL